MMKSMCGIHKVAFLLVVVGALNWGLIGAFNYNLVMALFGSMPMVERVVYILVGLSGLAMLAAGKCCMGEHQCGTMGMKDGKKM